MKPADDREEVFFREARQRPVGPEREAYLDQACAGNQALRFRLEALLQAHESPDPFLEPPAGPPGPTNVLSTPLTEKPGDRIGRYKLLQQIGEGGCGVVYMAEQEQPLRRRVALKVIKLGMDTKHVIARFEAERQALALMDHPNIAKVLDAGATDAGRPYFVMELVRGVRITDYCDQNNLSTEQRLDLFVPICHAIQHAHQKGIIHRDIKPSNILVTVHDGKPLPKIIDFGIAKATSGQVLTDKTLFTAFEQFIGTPAYMSPEQAEMSTLDIDTRGDIYALGVLLYELLTGQTPFDAQELLAAGLNEMRRIIREREPLRPSTRISTLAAADQTTVARQRHSEPPQLIHLVRGDLDWIVMKCLEKDRTRRYDTANGLAHDILCHLNDEPVMARPPSKLYRFQKLVRRNKLVFAAAAVVSGVLVLGVIVSAWQAVRATRAETLAKQRLTESEAISKFLIEVFKSPDPARDGRTITVAETLGAAAKKLETDLADQPARRAKLEATVAKTYYALGLTREALPLQEKVRDYYLAASGPEHADTLSAMEDLANSYAATDRSDEALKLQEEVLALRRKVLGPEHPDTLDAMGNLANFYSGARRFDEALKLREEALTLCRRVLGPEHPDTLTAINQLAVSYDETGRRDEALKLRKELLPLRRKVSGPAHPNTLWEMHNLAFSYTQAGRWDEAIKLQEDVLGLRRKVMGPEHPDTLWAMYQLAFSYDHAGRRDEALKLREEMLSLRRKVSGPEHPDTLSAMYVLAISYDEASRRDEALKLREEVLVLRRKAKGLEHPDTLWVMHNLANSYDEAGHWNKALKLREEVLPLLRKVIGPQHPNTLLAMHDLATSYDEAGRRDEALKLREEVLPLRRKVSGPEHPDTLWAMHDLATSYDEASRRDEALKLREEVLMLHRKLNGTEENGTLWAMHDLATSYDEAGRRDEALKLREEVLTLRRKVSGPEHPGTLDAMAGLADSYGEAGRRDEALKLREDVVALRRKMSGPEHLATLMAMYKLANSLDAAGRRDEALKLREELLALRRKVFGPEHPDTLTTLNDIARTLAASDATGIRNGTNAIRLAAEAVAASGRTNATFLDTLAAAYAETHQFDTAVSTQNEAIALLRNEVEKSDFKSRLRLYQDKTPYRQPTKNPAQ